MEVVGGAVQELRDQALYNFPKPTALLVGGLNVAGDTLSRLFDKFGSPIYAGAEAISLDDLASIKVKLKEDSSKFKEWKQKHLKTDNQEIGAATLSAIASGKVLDNITRVMLVGSKIEQGAAALKMEKQAVSTKVDLPKPLDNMQVFESNKIDFDKTKSKEQPWNIKPDQNFKYKIYGTGQKTGPRTQGLVDGHARTSYEIALEAAKRSDVDKVYLNRNINSITGAKLGDAHYQKPNIRADVTIVHKNGKIDLIEVPSASDKDMLLQLKINKVRDTLPLKMQGDTKVIPRKER